LKTIKKMHLVVMKVEPTVGITQLTNHVGEERMGAHKLEESVVSKELWTGIRDKKRSELA
jgi:hypothetical protein